MGVCSNMIPIVCRASAFYCSMLEEVFNRLGFDTQKSESSLSSAGIIAYAGRLDKDLAVFLDTVNKPGLRLVVGVEHSSGVPDKRVLGKISGIHGRGVKVLVIASTMREYSELKEKMPSIPVLHLPLHLFTGGGMRDMMPRDGGIVTHSDTCKDIEDLASMLGSVGFNPLLVNISEKSCSNPWIINVVTDNVFNLSHFIVAGLILDNSPASYMVLYGLYRNTRPIIVCSDIDVPPDTPVIIRRENCTTESLANAVISLFGRIEEYRRRSSERPRELSHEGNLVLLKEFLSS